MFIRLIENRQSTPVEKEVKRIRDRFEDIMSILEARGVNLEATLSEAEQYNAVYTDLIVWLDSAEDAQQKGTPVGNDLVTVRRQYLEHQVKLYKMNACS